MTLTDFARARDLMVDGQLRPNRVRNPRLLDAFRRLPRERFLPPALAVRAYLDANLDLGHGRTLLKPMVQAWMIETAAIGPGERVLVLPGGTGYLAALVAAIGGEVTALEPVAALADLGREAARDFAPEIRWLDGALPDGAAAHAPYDVLLVEGALRAMPETLAALLPQKGRAVAILAGETTSIGVLAERTALGFASRAVFDAAAPLVPELTPAPEFVF